MNSNTFSYRSVPQNHHQSPQFHSLRHSVKSRTGSSIETSANYSSSIKQIAEDLMKLEKVGSLDFKSRHNDSNQELSEIEAAILRSNEPIKLNSLEEICVNGERGILANKNEIDSWMGPLPLKEYPINKDDSPEIIRKKTSQNVEYVQELAVRYLKPPTPEEPGEIIIKQMPNIMIPPAPPIIIRQQPPRMETPEPIVFREAPPNPPATINRKIITISGKKLPPPPRKVIIERLAPLPPKPQSVIIERWLPYSRPRRRVILNRPPSRDAYVVNPKNIIVQWEAPRVDIKQEFKHLGVIRADPNDYMQRYGKSLIETENLPDFVTSIRPPNGVSLAGDERLKNGHNNPPVELIGDIEALRLVDLEKEGMGEYRSYLENRLQSSYSNAQLSNSLSRSFSKNQFGQKFETSLEELNDLVEKIFKSIDRDNNGTISLREAEKLFLKLNSRLQRRYGEDDVKLFFKTLDINHDNYIDLNEFKIAFLNLAASKLIHSFDKNVDNSNQYTLPNSNSNLGMSASGSMTSSNNYGNC